MTRVQEDPATRGIFWVDVDGAKHPATVSLAPGVAVYGERILRIRGKEYRLWNPFRSKLSAALLRGLKEVSFGPGSGVLYLGAASGTTSSHVSDIVGPGGRVFCVEFAPRPMRDLIRVCRRRPNMFPILGDARHPEMYELFIGKVDAIYCDVAQPDQAEILADNTERYLESGKGAMIAIKASSIDATRPVEEVYERELRVLRDRRFEIDEVVDLREYARAHVMVRATYTGEGPSA